MPPIPIILLFVPTQLLIGVVIPVVFGQVGPVNDLFMVVPTMVVMVPFVVDVNARGAPNGYDRKSQGSCQDEWADESGCSVHFAVPFPGAK